MDMNNREEIEELAAGYASCHSSHFYGYVSGFIECRDKIAEVIMNTPNDEDLGRKLRSLFLEKEILK